MELLLNILWLMLALPAFLVWRRQAAFSRSSGKQCHSRSFVLLGCLLALLFPVVLDRKPGASGVGGLPEIALENGDRLQVPSRPPTVAILGAVYNKNSFLYRREERVDGYLKRSGGPTRDADRDRMFLIRADAPSSAGSR